jgi:hypothetical protein
MTTVMGGLITHSWFVVRREFHFCCRFVFVAESKHPFEETPTLRRLKIEENTHEYLNNSKFQM